MFLQLLYKLVKLRLNKFYLDLFIFINTSKILLKKLKFDLIYLCRVLQVIKYNACKNKW